MNSKKQTLLALFVASTLLVNPTFASGIPTVDVAAAASWMNQSKQMLENLEHLKTQINNQLETINSIKNVKDLDGAIRAMTALENMPDEWANIYKSVEKIDPTGELKKIKFNPEMAKENAMKDLKAVEALQKQFDQNNPTGFRRRLEQATNLLKTADSQVGVQKATAMIMAEQVRMQQAMFEYDTIKAKYAANEKANELKKKEIEKCYYANYATKEFSKCRQ